MKFSILTAVWNRAETLPDALQSLDAQSYRNFEHVVQDGGSSDGTLELLKGRNDPQMRLVSEADRGIYDALNRATARATGDVIGLLHSDDFFAHGEVLARVAKVFQETDADAVYGDLDYVSGQDSSKVVRHWVSGPFSLGKLKRGWMPPHPSLFIKRDVITRYGAYDDSFQISADYDSILRYFGRGRISAAYLPEVLTKMRLGGASNGSVVRIIRKSKEDYRAVRRNGVGGASTLIMKNARKLPQFLKN
ncbi:glycosyltransferase family 2 protein [Ruegeria arenilitoris]|uniref:glycosyltransferase family 2 protein n=1 Tax=Ruegeria arenilitoris TaxID=1173585 RepID=UPI0014801B82|nr:glycosyltransferase family 2 protein [Ruegeria arenilitoris]